MPYQQIEPASKQLTIVIGLTVVGFMAFGLAHSFYRNVLFDQTLENIGVKNRELREKISTRKRTLEYYGSSQYKDKYAKESLGLVSPGEQVLIISEKFTGEALTEEEQLSALERQQVAYEELLRQMPVWEHWRLFLFHRKKIDELKRGL